MPRSTAHRSPDTVQQIPISWCSTNSRQSTEYATSTTPGLAPNYLSKRKENGKKTTTRLFKKWVVTWVFRGYPRYDFQNSLTPTCTWGPEVIQLQTLNCHPFPARGRRCQQEPTVVIRQAFQYLRTHSSHLHNRSEIAMSCAPGKPRKTMLPTRLHSVPVSF